MAIPDKKGPSSHKLYPGIYYYCRCGKSAEYPFCSGAHEGSDVTPKKFRIDVPKAVYLCGCGHTQTAPYCDGMHAKR